MVMLAIWQGILETGSSMCSQTWVNYKIRDIADEVAFLYLAHIRTMNQRCIGTYWKTGRG
jgi:hypothetical protein